MPSHLPATNKPLVKSPKCRAFRDSVRIWIAIKTNMMRWYSLAGVMVTFITPPFRLQSDYGRDFVMPYKCDGIQLEWTGFDGLRLECGRHTRASYLLMQHTGELNDMMHWFAPSNWWCTWFAAQNGWFFFWPSALFHGYRSKWIALRFEISSCFTFIADFAAHLKHFFSICQVLTKNFSGIRFKN